MKQHMAPRSCTLVTKGPGGAGAFGPLDPVRRFRDYGDSARLEALLLLVSRFPRRFHQGHKNRPVQHRHVQSPPGSAPSLRRSIRGPLIPAASSSPRRLVAAYSPALLDFRQSQHHAPPSMRVPYLIIIQFYFYAIKRRALDEDELSTCSWRLRVLAVKTGLFSVPSAPSVAKPPYSAASARSPVGASKASDLSNGNVSK